MAASLPRRSCAWTSGPGAAVPKSRLFPSTKRPTSLFPGVFGPNALVLVGASGKCLVSMIPANGRAMVFKRHQVQSIYGNHGSATILDVLAGLHSTLLLSIFPLRALTRPRHFWRGTALPENLAGAKGGMIKTRDGELKPTKSTITNTLPKPGMKPEGSPETGLSEGHLSGSMLCCQKFPYFPFRL